VLIKVATFDFAHKKKEKKKDGGQKILYEAKCEVLNIVYARFSAVKCTSSLLHFEASRIP